MPFLIFLDRIVSIVQGRVLKSPEDNKINESIATGGHKVRPYGMKILYYVVNLGISDCRGEPCVLPKIIKLMNQ